MLMPLLLPVSPIVVALSKLYQLLCKTPLICHAEVMDAIAHCQGNSGKVHIGLKIIHFCIKS